MQKDFLRYVFLVWCGCESGREKKKKGQQAETKVGDVHSSEKSTDALEECRRG